MGGLGRMAGQKALVGLVKDVVGRNMEGGGQPNDCFGIGDSKATFDAA